VKLQTHGSLVAYPFGVEVYDCQFTQGGLPLHHQPSSQVGVPRSLDGSRKPPCYGEPPVYSGGDSLPMGFFK